VVAFTLVVVPIVRPEPPAPAANAMLAARVPTSVMDAIDARRSSGMTRLSRSDVVRRLLEQSLVIRAADGRLVADVLLDVARQATWERD